MTAADRLLEELAESSLPGARYAHEVVQLRLPTVLQQNAAAERAAIRREVAGLHLPLGNDLGYDRARDDVLDDVIRVLDARSTADRT